MNMQLTHLVINLGVVVGEFLFLSFALGFRVVSCAIKRKTASTRPLT